MAEMAVKRSVVWADSLPDWRDQNGNSLLIRALHLFLESLCND